MINPSQLIIKNYKVLEDLHNIAIEQIKPNKKICDIY